jgi:hypothetical protein
MQLLDRYLRVYKSFHVYRKNALQDVGVGFVQIKYNFNITEEI